MFLCFLNAVIFFQKCTELHFSFAFFLCFCSVGGLIIMLPPSLFFFLSLSLPQSLFAYCIPPPTHQLCFPLFSPLWGPNRQLLKGVTAVHEYHYTKVQENYTTLVMYFKRLFYFIFSQKNDQKVSFWEKEGLPSFFQGGAYLLCMLK